MNLILFSVFFSFQMRNLHYKQTFIDKLSVDSLLQYFYKIRPFHGCSEISSFATSAWRNNFLTPRIASFTVSDLLHQMYDMVFQWVYISRYFIGSFGSLVDVLLESILFITGPRYYTAEYNIIFQAGKHVFFAWRILDTIKIKKQGHLYQAFFLSRLTRTCSRT